MMSHRLRDLHPLRKLDCLFILLVGLVYHYGDANLILLILLLLTILFIPFDILNYETRGRSRYAKLFFRLYPKKREEKSQFLSDASVFFISTMLMISILPKDVVIFAIVIYALSDPSEAVFGVLLPLKKLSWNVKKTWGGTLAGFIVSLIVGFLAINLLNLPLKSSILIPVSIIAALAGTVKTYDNVIIPWTVSFATLML